MKLILIDVETNAAQNLQEKAVSNPYGYPQSQTEGNKISVDIFSAPRYK